MTSQYFTHIELLPVQQQITPIDHDNDNNQTFDESFFLGSWTHHNVIHQIDQALAITTNKQHNIATNPKSYGE
jgi:hypothetical protein